jgi:hypothetical protein
MTGTPAFKPTSIGELYGAVGTGIVGVAVGVAMPKNMVSLLALKFESQTLPLASSAIP